MAVNLTEAAASEIKRVMQEQNRPELKYVRVGVAGGGCSGFQYSFGFAESYDESADLINEQH
ncbi:MAG: iron-sulfur cluster assembly accessory protein, partial [Planctomycetaceae bacterium]|nr:iron-sulfur cluster assembly accessory protein [Planctomycetaceae bacterium]